jgi:hypothetical protein
VCPSSRHNFGRRREEFADNPRYVQEATADDLIQEHHHSETLKGRRPKRSTMIRSGKAPQKPRRAHFPANARQKETDPGRNAAAMLGKLKISIWKNNIQPHWTHNGPLRGDRGG